MFVISLLVEDNNHEDDRSSTYNGRRSKSDLNHPLELSPSQNCDDKTFQSRVHFCDHIKRVSPKICCSINLSAD